MVSTQKQQKHDIRLEQYRLLHQQAIASQTGGLIIAAVLIAMMYQTSDVQTLLSWGTALLALTGARYLAWRYYRPKIHNDDAAQAWFKVITVLLFVSGCVWATSALLFYPADNLLLVGLLCALHIALIAGAIGSLSSVISCYIIYILPIAITVATRLFLESEIPLAAPLGFASFAVVCSVYARNIQNTIIESIALRFENQILIEQLQLNEKQLKTAVQSAQEASAAKSRFLAVASHDLSQPLHALELFTASMIEEGNPEKRDKLMQNAHKSTRMLSDMFASLLDISKLEANIVTADIDKINISDVLKPLIVDLSPRAEAKQLKLEVDIEDAWLNTDATLLQRVVLNLIGNALKYTESGNIILTGAAHTQDYAITISDTGPGIPAADLRNIFKDYYQVNGQAVGGMGLGLAIVARIAELLHISIEVSSQIGAGTTFVIKVPYEAK